MARDVVTYLLRAPQSKIDIWREKAALSGMSLREWIEHHLDDGRVLDRVVIVAARAANADIE